MRGVRIPTARLLIRDLPPNAGRLTARFHRDNLHFHQPWEPSHPERYYTTTEQRRILRGERRSDNTLHLWMLEAGDGSGRRSPVIVGSITLSSIVRGFFQSCFLGYKLSSGHARRGFMEEALFAVVDYAFAELGLHRIEANIMPGNDRSLRLVDGLGFREEGTATRYLRIRDRWEDHVHMVMLSEDWAGRDPAT